MEQYVFPPPYALIRPRYLSGLYTAWHEHMLIAAKLHVNSVIKFALKYRCRRGCRLYPG
jgi:hypothetical protein